MTAPFTPEASALDAAPNITPCNVIEALSRVMLELPAIGKDQRIEEGPQKYAYRGIESITAHASQLLGAYGVVFVPKVLSVEPFPYESRSGGQWVEWRMLIEYTVYGPGGREDFIMAGPFYTLGRDNSDKGTNKCMTAAFKYALIQLLCIGDKADDPDATRDETAAPTPDSMARADGWHDFADWKDHERRLSVVVEALDGVTQARFGRWLAQEGIVLPGPKAGWERAYAKAVEKTNPGTVATADPISSGPVAEPVVTPGESDEPWPDPPGGIPTAEPRPPAPMPTAEDVAATAEAQQRRSDEQAVSFAEKMGHEVPEEIRARHAERIERAKASLAAAEAASREPSLRRSRKAAASVAPSEDPAEPENAGQEWPEGEEPF